MLEVLYPYATFGGARISPAAGAAKNVEFVVYLFVCLSVRHAFERQSLCARFRHEGVGIGPTETVFMPLDRGRFIVGQPCSTFSVCCQFATPLNAEVQKTPTIGGFSPTDGDRINRSRRNLARKRTPWVCYIIPLVKGGRYRSPQISKFAKNCGFWLPEADTMNTFR